MHTICLQDALEVITEHGAGIVLYITVYGHHQNDLWCIANKADGRIRHYQTTQVQLAPSGVMNMNSEQQEKNTVGGIIDQILDDENISERARVEQAIEYLESHKQLLPT